MDEYKNSLNQIDNEEILKWKKEIFITIEFQQNFWGRTLDILAIFLEKLLKNKREKIYSN